MGLVVSIDGMEVPADSTDGWSVARNGHAILFNGLSCAAFYGASRRTIDLHVRC